MNKVYNYYNKNLQKLRRGKSNSKQPQIVKNNKENYKTQNDQSNFQDIYQKLTKQHQINLINRKQYPFKKQHRILTNENQKLKTEQSFPVIIHHSTKNKETSTRLFHSVQRKRTKNNSITQTTQIYQHKLNSKKYFPLPPTNLTYKKTNNYTNHYNSLLTEEITADLFDKIEINNNFQAFNQIILHYKRILDITAVIKKQNDINQDLVLQNIKQYVLQNDNSDISKLDKLFTQQSWKKKAKQFVFYQRVIILLLVQYIIKKRYKFQSKCFKLITNIIKQQYLCIFQIIIKSFTQTDQINKIPNQMISLINQDTTKSSKIIFNQNQNLNKRILKLLKLIKDFNHFYQFTLKNISNFTINLAFYKLLEFYSLHLAINQSSYQNPVPFLSTCPSPYLHYPNKKQYTLVLDLDQTLVHYKQYKNVGEFQTRPHTQQFIKQLSEYFQIGIFTCGMPDYADWVVRHLQGIQFTLYRYHAIQLKTGFIKDLSRIGRDLKKLIMIDNLPQNFKLTPENGIRIKAWYDDQSDQQLFQLKNILKEVALLKYDDIRTSLKEVLEQKRYNNRF